MDLKSFDWKKTIGTLAPMLGTALGTPLAGAAIAVISNAIFGTETASEEAISDAIQGGKLTGDNIVALKNAEQQFKLDMERIGVDLRKLEYEQDKLYIGDVQDARARQIATRDNMPQIIFFLMLFADVAFMVMFMRGSMPTDEFTRALITTGFGSVNSGFVGAVAYFIGSSRGSKTSGDAVRRIAEQQPLK